MTMCCDLRPSFDIQGFKVIYLCVKTSILEFTLLLIYMANVAFSMINEQSFYAPTCNRSIEKSMLTR